MMEGAIRLSCNLRLLSVKNLLKEQPVRFARHKPWEPRFRLFRKLQPFRRPPDISSLRAKYLKGTPMGIHKKMREDGFLTPAPFMDKTLTVTDSGQIFELYEPVEGDGKASLISTERARQEVAKVTGKGKSYRAERKIRQYDEDFSSAAFAEEALELYKKAHDMLQNLKENEVDLFDVATEHAYKNMTEGMAFKTFRWKYHGSIEPPKTVLIRIASVMNDDDRFAQATVRIFSKQSMAIYDRFGKPCYGSEDLVKDVLEYVVFEKHLADEYGRWRLHAKVVPEWMPPKNVYLRTMRVSSQEQDVDQDEDDEVKHKAKIIDEDVDDEEESASRKQ